MEGKSMKRKFLPVALVAVMAVNMAACGTTDAPAPAPESETAPAEPATEEPAEGGETEAPAETEEPVEEESEYTPITINGEVPDLGGMEIVVRDWWTDPANHFLTSPQNEYDEARKDYVEWAEETYNFKITQQAISDWGGTPQDFVDYASKPDDGNNYIFIIRDDPAIASAMSQGLLYDLSKCDFLDFNEDIFTANLVHQQYTYKGGIYAMYMGVSEPRGGFFFNKKILEDAGVDIDADIYDKQANDTWTWDAFEDILKKVQKDTDNDGTNDIWGVTGNTGGWLKMFAASNGGEFVGNSAEGYTYRLEDPETIEGMEFAIKLLDNYYMPRPEDAQWDYYKEEFKGGTVAFCENGGMYATNPGGEFNDITDFEVGYVMCPKGPKGTMTNIWSNNPTAIPSNYSDEKAQNLAFAYYVYNLPPVGYEDYNGFISTARSGNMDDRGCEETVPLSSDPAHGMITYDGMIPNMNVGEDFAWKLAPGMKLSENIDAIRDNWKNLIDIANGNQ